MLAPALRALTLDILNASVPQIMRIVALVDSMIRRGPADDLIDPLRDRLAHLRPPRPLRFDRLLLHPLDLLIVPTPQWRPAWAALPRTALTPMAEHVRLALGATGAAIVTEIDGCTTDDTALIARLGATLWPAAAEILAGGCDMKGPFRPLPGIVSTLLAEACGVETLRMEAATGLLPVGAVAIEAIFYRVIRVNPAALPMMIAMLLDALPGAADLLPLAHPGLPSGVVTAALDQAADVLLRQLDRDEGVERRIAAGTFAEAGGTAGRIATMLLHLDNATTKPPRRELLRAVRQRLDAACRERFASGLRDDVLVPPAEDGVDISFTHEAAARGLRVLESAGRTLGGGADYDRRLREAAETIARGAPWRRVPLRDRLRLVEVLAGSDAALRLLDAPAG
jgi:hypothetical protein